jgi:hypothetical protein
MIRLPYIFLFILALCVNYFALSEATQYICTHMYHIGIQVFQVER